MGNGDDITFNMVNFKRKHAYNKALCGDILWLVKIKR